MKTIRLLIVIVLTTTLLLVACSSAPRVGELQTESHSVELGDAKAIDVSIDFGAGDLTVSGGASKLLEADFNYNVAELKPVLTFTDGTLLVEQPGVHGLPIPQGITDFRNEWSLHLNNDVPLNLKVNMGAGNSDLQLAGLSLTGLDVTLGAGTSNVDLSGNWARDLDVTFDAGAADLNVRLPKDVGVRVEVETGPSAVESHGLTQDGNIYTNAAYGESKVTLQINIKAGIGRINLELVDNS